MHELSVGWLTPLDETQSTLAEYLGSKGYATAGFVANTSYCARDSGLGRGFTHYDDFTFPKLTAFRKTSLVSRVLSGIQTAVSFLEEQFEAVWMRWYADQLSVWLIEDRKPAALVSRELLDWLASRGQPERPFFAFLNYFDAHYPYLLPRGRYHRFGGAPADIRDRAIIERCGNLDKRSLTPTEVALGIRAYDDCIADLDEQIGWLADRLERDGILERTWLIVVADHGESFGEHRDTFTHGSSLYQTEVHVPLLIVPPGGNLTGQVVSETVSTRDLAATIAELTGQSSGAPFPGRSLSRFWDPTKRSAPLTPALADTALSEVVPNQHAPENLGAAGQPRPVSPLGALKNADWSYIRREEGDIREQLFRMPDDLNERRNLASDPSQRSALEGLRAALDRITAGPLTPQRLGR
jgi:arylsulfatase A-like enzyme